MVSREAFLRQKQLDVIFIVFVAVLAADAMRSVQST